MRPIEIASRRTTGSGTKLLASILLTCLAAASAEAASVSFVSSDDASDPVAHGLAQVKAALEAQGLEVENAASLEEASGAYALVAGVASGTGPASELLDTLNLTPNSAPESMLIRKFTMDGKTVALVTGADAPGVMYGLLDVADRVGWAKEGTDPFRELIDVEEKPYAPERALSLYTMHRTYWESRFYDEAYWSRYLDLLARNRFNSLVVIFGYENGGFLAPAYPYFFDVPGFPDVRVVGLTREQQERNLRALKRLIAMAHARGLRVTLGFWDHIYRGGVQGGGIPGADEWTQRPVPGLVWGVTGENLFAYTKAALAEFLRRVPEVDALQFRMHNESGLKNSEKEGFWREIFEMIKSEAPEMRLDLRAKELPDSVIECAADLGVNFRITTKYWMEQMGLPFHPTHINRQNQFDRRHSYADLLRYPQRYKMHWRLWNGGTARVLLWGSPDYARRFVESTRLYDGDGFEVNEPLCTKMEAQPHDAEPFELLTADHRYYDYEFERYWHFFQVFGRLGYSPDTPSEVWQREFEARFGDAAPYVRQGLHEASWVLPRIVASCYPYRGFPMTRGWAEKQRLGNLPAFAKAEGSDIQQFANFDEEALLLLEGGESAKIRPAENSRWFQQRAAQILALADDAERHAGSRPNKELSSTLVDLRILGNLALFHARRIPAAVNYRLFERTKDPKALGDAIAHERDAIEAWRELVAAAGDFYSEDLMMGVRGANLCGHWKDELTALETDLATLERRQRESEPNPDAKRAPRFPLPDAPGDDSAPLVMHQPITTAPAGQPIEVTAEIRDPAGVKWVRVRYRSLNQHQDYRTQTMVPTGSGDQYRAVVPAEDLSPTWDLMYFIEAMGKDGNGRIYPDLNRETPYIVVRLQR